MAKNNDEKVLANNKKARHEYFLEEFTEAGIVLRGTEVKSIKEGKVSIKEAYCQVINGEMYILAMHVSPYEQGSFSNEDPYRKRKLLLNKKEIRKFESKVKEKGYTIVPLKVVVRKGLVKVDIALAKGKNLYDKRESIKKRDDKRKIDRLIRDFNY